MTAFFKLLAAGPAFFFSAWLLMIFAGIEATDVGIRPFGYLTSMVVTIGLWLVLAPAIGAVANRPRGPRNDRGGVGWTGCSEAESRAAARPGSDPSREPPRQWGPTWLP